MPVDLIKSWHERKKYVLISVGGERGLWTPIFANPEIFVDSIARIIEENDLDGVDLDIEGRAFTGYTS
jgi:chitinase